MNSFLERGLTVLMSAACLVVFATWVLGSADLIGHGHPVLGAISGLGCVIAGAAALYAWLER